MSGDRIAIVGIGGVFPGAPDAASLWAPVAAARSLARPAPPGRWLLDPDTIAAPQVLPDHVLSPRACFVEDFESDNQPRPLDLSFQFLRQAGHAAWREGATAGIAPHRAGVIIGNIVLPTDATSAIADEVLGALWGERSRRAQFDPRSRFAAGLPALYLAQSLGLEGRAYTLDAACASSLYAIKLACDELRARRADAMLAGGLSRPDSLYTQMGFSALHALSPTGRCSPFDHKADGLVVGEGCGMLLLKRYDDALRDGDHIHAIVAGIGVSNDVDGNLMLPDSEGQLRAMRAAYRRARWQPQDVQLIECHGTGTPRGDAVELASLRALWGDGAIATGLNRCVLGSVKSNIGHLLTAAGAAGVIKVLLAMRHGQLPPTANFERGADALNLATSPFELLEQPRPWNARAGTPRRAAVSAFGFGGINGHLLLEAPQIERSAPRPVRSEPPRESEPVAIVGLAAHVGPWSDARQVARRVLAGDEVRPAPPAHWWGHPGAGDYRGYFLGEVSVPIGRFRIPPAELADMLPQQLLMLQTAADALADAGIEGVSGPRLKTGVFIGISLDPNTTNFHLRWAQPNARRDAISPPLTANRTMGALGGIVASRIARAFRVGGPSFTLSSEQRSSLDAIQTAVEALQRRELDVALAGGVDLAADPRLVLPETQLDPDRPRTPLGEGAAALVLKRLGDAKRDGDHIYGLLGAPGEHGTPTDLHLDTLAEQVGACGAALHAIGAVVLAQALDERILGAPLRPWLHDRSGGVRAARVAASEGGALVLTELPRDAARRPRALPVVATPRPLDLPPALIAVSGDAPEALRAELTRLATMSLADAVASARHRSEDPLAVVLLANSDEALRAAIAEAQAAVRANRPRTTARVCYTPSPLGESPLALVFPGAGNAFAGMGRTLGLAFPDVLDRLEHESTHLREQFAAGRFWDGSDVSELTHQQHIFGHVWLGALVHDVLAELGVRPEALIGYSLGETTALFAARAWTGRDAMLARMNDSTLFASDLAPPWNAARKAWGLPDGQPVRWECGVVNVPAATVREAIADLPRAYLLIINSPSECVIGGDAGQVSTLARRLGAPLHPVTSVTTVHCEVARPVEAAYRALHRMPTRPPAGVQFYSAARGGAYEVTEQTAAEALLGQALETVDFAGLIEQAYADGVRIFVEAGPGSSCSRMIGATLADRPHLALAVCPSGRSALEATWQALAQLVAHRCPVDTAAAARTWAAWQPPAPEVETRRQVTVKVGREAVVMPGRDEQEAVADPVTTVARTGTSARPPVMAAAVATSPAAPVPDAVTASESPLAVAAAAAHGDGGHDALVAQWLATQSAVAGAQAAFLRLAQQRATAMAESIELAHRLLEANPALAAAATIAPEAPQAATPAAAALATAPSTVPPRALDRQACLAYAIGRIGDVLGPQFAPIDAFPTRVRLPDEPLMLVDRILDIEGEPLSMTHGRLVTEHDVLPGAWYLDGGRIPTCIAVEAGQADLFLSGYLGIDMQTRGLAVYRLLDAAITFHGPLPRPGDTIRYDIRISGFFRQDDTYLFRFEFDGTVDGQPVLTMRQGCAGFFTEEELAAGRGIVLTEMDKRPMPGKRDERISALAPPVTQTESYGDAALDALRQGDLAGCFGDAFAGLPLERAAGLPGGRMTLVDRILRLEPGAGRYGLGQITGEADIHGDDWFLTCHFVDDQVMPGTLMYECCLHTLRVYLLRMGWVGEEGSVVYEPVPEERSALKCRGQVIATTRKVQYQLTLKEIGYRGPEETPYVLADALMFADGRAIVQMNNMSVQLSGLTRAGVEALWARGRAPATAAAPSPELAADAPLFDTDRILAFAVGKPSEAFGEPYRVFDEQRIIARLPGPPYQFLDRITRIEGCQPFKLAAGGDIDARYDVPTDAWYFSQDRQSRMPYAVLLEIALQPCGWLAAYVGSALSSETDLSFRNLGGNGIQHRAITPQSGTLTTRVKMTGVSRSGGMIIQNYTMQVSDARGPVFTGDTYFGFFSKAALANQVGLRDVSLYVPSAAERARGKAMAYPDAAPLPDRMMRMVDRVDLLDLQGGPSGKGVVLGSAKVDPEAWFFRAHFYQDPVWPGSLGLESFLQLLKVAALERWGGDERTAFQAMALDRRHRWTYRGQIIPSDRQVTVQALISDVDDATRTLTAQGLLIVDGRVIYQMTDFALSMP